MDSEGNNPKGKTTTKPEGTEATTENAAIKSKAKGEAEVNKKEIKPYEMSDFATKKRLCYSDKQENEDETGRKMALIRQEAQSEEAVARYDKTIGNKEQKNITVKGNGRWCVQDKIQNKQNSAAQKKDTYNDVTYKYLWIIDGKRNKLIILRKDGIEKYKAFKEDCTNENKILTLIYKSSEESVKGSDMNQVENERYLLVKYKESKKN